MELRLTLEGGAGLGRRLTKWSGGDRCHSGGFLLRIMPPSWQPVPACTSNGHSAGVLFFAAATTAAGGPFNTATTGYRRRNYSSLRQRKLESDAATLRQGLRRRAVQYCDNGLPQVELLFFETTKIRIGRVTVAANTAAGELFYLPERWHCSDSRFQAQNWQSLQLRGSFR